MGLGADLEREAPGLWEQRRRERHGRVAQHWHLSEEFAPWGVKIAVGEGDELELIDLREADALAADPEPAP